MRPEGPTAGVGFLGGVREPSPHQLGDLGERCKLPTTPSGVRVQTRKIQILEHFGTSEITSELSVSF